jgi:hypothetical protein
MARGVITPAARQRAATTTAPTEANAAVVALRTMLGLDATIAAVADLPPGWIAHRETAAAPWRREAR